MHRPHNHYPHLHCSVISPSQPYCSPSPPFLLQERIQSTTNVTEKNSEKKGKEKHSNIVNPYNPVTQNRHRQVMIHSPQRKNQNPDQNQPPNSTQSYLCEAPSEAQVIQTTSQHLRACPPPQPKFCCRTQPYQLFNSRVILSSSCDARNTSLNAGTHRHTSPG